ncbi:MAG: hypothetical protein NC453_25020 [Muribaculum sp.]|nr:hypothetical protein [Muribaculum sp.]
MGLNLLDPNAELFDKLRKNPPQWWNTLIADPEIYIEIRKDNKIHAYFYGARIAEIKIASTSKELEVKCHIKYLNGKNETSSKYVDCQGAMADPKKFKTLKKNAIDCYVGEDEGEDISEKRIQGRLRIDNPQRYIDSEFEYSLTKDKSIRFDLVSCQSNVITIEELKRIGDSRLRNSDMVEKLPEIYAQITDYTRFIESNVNELVQFYTVLLQIKSSLGLPVPPDYDCTKPLIIQREPLLIIKNHYYYSKMGKKRCERIKDIQKFLSTHKIKYYILP